MLNVLIDEKYFNARDNFGKITTAPVFEFLTPVISILEINLPEEENISTILWSAGRRKNDRKTEENECEGFMNFASDLIRALLNVNSLSLNAAGESNFVDDFDRLRNISISSIVA